MVRDLSSIGEIKTVLIHFRADAIMHFASKSLVGESMKDPFLYLGDNVTNALNLLNVQIH